MFRSFSIKLALFFVSLVLILPGCQNMQQMPPFDFQKLISIGAGGVAAVGCYQMLGGGNMRYVTGAACGAGAYLVADWLQKGATNQRGQGEANRIGGQYQSALNTNIQGTARYQITSSIPEGNVLIDLRLFPSQYNRNINNECRAFFEQILVNGHVRSNKNRSACRNPDGRWDIIDS